MSWVHNKESWGETANAVQWSFFGVTTGFLALRLYARAHFGRARGGGLGLDDYITILCWLVFLVSNIFASIAYSWGLGSHFKTLTPQQQVMAGKWNVITNVILIWQFSLPKFAIVAVTGRLLNWGTKTACLFWGLATLSQIGIFVTSVWWVHQCSPPASAWNPEVDGVCASPKIISGLGTFTSSFSAFLDLFFAVYPIPTLMKLHMPLKRRIGVIAALGASGLGAVIGIYKITILGSILALIPTDPTFPTPALFCVTLGEGTLNIICASLPALGPLVRPLGNKVYSLSHKSTTDPGNQSTSRSRHAGSNAAGNSWQPLGEGNGSRSDRERNVDEYPLVGKHDPQNQIFRTMEVSVDVESASMSRPENRKSAF